MYSTKFNDIVSLSPPIIGLLVPLARQLKVLNKPVHIIIVSVCAFMSKCSTDLFVIK